jgi:hypothetical protein
MVPPVGTADKDILYKVAYDEAVRALSEQQNVIDSLRNRAGILLSAAAITTSFLGAQALDGGDSGPAVWLAMSGFVSVALASLAILWAARMGVHDEPTRRDPDLYRGRKAGPIEELHRDLSPYEGELHQEPKRPRTALDPLSGREWPTDHRGSPLDHRHRSDRLEFGYGTNRATNSAARAEAP